MNIFEAAKIDLVCQICGEDIDFAHINFESPKPVCCDKACHEEFDKLNS